jgi:hypothetical protein|tara:strand:+ start:45 stop:224 length:180 start_codon:yes stop_codon:yes gene_type:complete
MGAVKNLALDLEEENINEDDYFEHAMNNPWLDLDIKEQKIAERLEDIAIQNQIDKARGK